MVNRNSKRDKEVNIRFFRIIDMQIYNWIGRVVLISFAFTIAGFFLVSCESEAEETISKITQSPIIIEESTSNFPLCQEAVHTTSFSSEEEWLWNYDGTIDDQKSIRMTLVFSGNDVEGVYFYTSQFEDIRIEGCLENSREIFLNEYDVDGNIVAVFHGEFAAVDPKGGFSGGNLQREVIIGIWESINSSESYPFYVKIESGSHGNLNHKYASAGVENDQIFEEAAQTFWRAVIDGNKEEVANHVAYPIVVIVGGQRKNISNEASFIENYETIFTSDFVQLLGGYVPHNMFSNYSGVMLGRGEIWFESNGKVIAIGNPEGNPGWECFPDNEQVSLITYGSYRVVEHQYLGGSWMTEEDLKEYENIVIHIEQDKYAIDQKTKHYGGTCESPCYIFGPIYDVRGRGRPFGISVIGSLKIICDGREVSSFDVLDANSLGYYGAGHYFILERLPE